MRRLRRALPVLVVTIAVPSIAASAASADSISASCTRAGQSNTCNSTTWYTSPLSVIWLADSPPDSTSGCALDVAYHYNTDTVSTVSCSATWPGPSTDSKQYTIHVETSSPLVSALPSRPPDSNGWYNHPVAVSFAGSSFSGIASCTPTTTYGGPDASNATVSGSCTDNAGKTASASASLNYDATPPSITGATPSRPPDFNSWYTHPVSFTFTGTDSGSGIVSCDTVTYAGPSSGSVVGGCRDQAGNSATLAVPVRYLQVLSPVPGARAASVKSTPLLLHWKAIRRASYYNVQIYRGGRKVLSTWPSKTSLLVSSSWRFAGHRFHLKSGRYRWYVWPGYGSRTAARYGKMLVSATFNVSSHG